MLWKGKNIAQILELTVEDAAAFFKDVPTIARKLQTLLDVGLSYIRLGQAATTLSGGEAQRVKLAQELSKRDTGRTLYILDEPTTGLHFADIDLLLKVLEAGDIHMHLTESLAMMPAASVSGFYLSHPEAAYFNVGKIGGDQVEDWARRTGLSVDDAERALAPLL